MGVQNHTAASAEGASKIAAAAIEPAWTFLHHMRTKKANPACSRNSPPSQPQNRKQSRRRGNKARRQRSEIGNRREDSWVTRARGAECTSIATRVIRCDMAATPCCAREMVAEESSSGQPASAQIAANHRKRRRGRPAAVENDCDAAQHRKQRWTPARKRGAAGIERAYGDGAQPTARIVTAHGQHCNARGE